MLEAIVASAIFDSIYAALFASEAPSALSDPRSYVSTHVISTVLLFLIGGVVVPYVIAWIFYGQVPFLRPVSSFWTSKIRPLLTASQEANDTPTAWDYGNKAAVEGWVRIRIAEGVWVGGVFDERSRFSTYPEARDIFISEQWNISPAGEFESKVPGTQGIWVAVVDSYVVEWLLEEGTRNELASEQQ